MSNGETGAPAQDSGDGAVMCRPLPVFYSLGAHDVGDMVNPDVVNSVSGFHTVWERPSDRPQLFGIGSILHRSCPETRIWGTGCAGPRSGIGEPDGNHVLALRGKLTARQFSAGGIRLGDVPLGDPGWLAPRVFAVKRQATPSYRLGIAAYGFERVAPAIRKLLEEEGVLELDVHAPPRQFLERMAECSSVVSTALHGLIFAEALGIPNLWAKVDEEPAGGGFRFLDWFSTTTEPQDEAVTLNEDVHVSDLVSRTRLHGSAIDTDALLNALDTEQMEPLLAPETRPLIPVEACRRRPMAAFVISHNRGDMLRRTIEGLRRQDLPVDVVVRDNGSTDQATLAVLDDLKKQGIVVDNAPPLRSVADLNLVNDTVSGYFENWAEPQKYVVTDGDIDLGEASPMSLSIYSDLLDANREIDAAGPMLRIRDIPEGYPLQRHAWNRHIAQFWSRKPRVVESRQGKVAVQEGKIDTTLAVHRAGAPFRRQRKAFRVYAPYEARHLDWYIRDLGRMRETTSASHWSNHAYYKRHARELLRYEGFWDVTIHADGAPRVVWRELPITRVERVANVIRAIVTPPIAAAKRAAGRARAAIG